MGPKLDCSSFVSDNFCSFLLMSFNLLLFYYDVSILLLKDLIVCGIN